MRFDMVRRGYFAHTSPGGSTPRDRTRRAGYRGTRIGEMIQFAIGRDATRQRAVRGWLDSPPHRRILLGARTGTSASASRAERPLHRGDGATAVVDVGG